MEMRHPLLDRRLAEFCLGLPPEQKLRDGWTRYVMRRAVANVLPEAVGSRAWKLNPSAAFVTKLVDTDSEWVEEVLRENEDVLAPYVDLQAVRERFRSYQTRGDYYGAAQVFYVASLGMWLRRNGLTA
jgi:asparagine synthase (glutamine-hydrolysing)